MFVSRLLCLFVIYSLYGWVYETIYCTVKSQKWENRGFLFGPFCPIYGFGAVAISAIADKTTDMGIILSISQLFLISVIGSAVLEFVTSWTLEKIFHAIWWDYSMLPFNIQGRISLFTSLGFGAAGVVIVYYIAPFTEKVMDHLSPMITECLALIFLFIITVDLTLTVVALYHFERVVLNLEENFNNNMEAIVDNTVQQTNRVRMEIKEKGRDMNAQINLLGSYVKSAVYRVHSFRAVDKKFENAKNRLRSMINDTRGRSYRVKK